MTPNTNQAVTGNWHASRLSTPMKTQIYPRAGNERPRIELEESDHPLSLDFHNGISIERAQKIAEIAMHR